jgi:hypothetical protein
MPLRRLTILAIAVLATWVTARPAAAEEAATATQRIGWFGLSRDVRLEGSLGTATRELRDGRTLDGGQFYVQCEAGKFVKASRLGNLAGIEVNLGLGYTAASGDPTGSDVRRGIRAVSPVLFDLGVGFPVTLLHLGGEGGQRFMLGFSPGMGWNFLHAYLSLKLKAAARLTDKLVAEASWQWVPGTVSLPSGDTPVNRATLKGSLYWGTPGDSAWLAFVEYTQAQWESEQPGATNAAYFGGLNPFTRTDRGPFEGSWLVGGGMAW